MKALGDQRVIFQYEISTWEIVMYRRLRLVSTVITDCLLSYFSMLHGNCISTYPKTHKYNQEISKVIGIHRLGPMNIFKQNLMAILQGLSPSKGHECQYQTDLLVVLDEKSADY